jgi:hypothetical protein
MRSILILTLILTSVSALGQDSARRNTIKLDITTRWLYRQAYTLSYERVVNPKRTWAVMAGYQLLPEAKNLGPGIAADQSTTASGYKLGAEYRFYLAKENKYPAPHGVYLGPYVSFNGFANERTIHVDNAGTPETARLNSHISVLNIGFQLGYQFVFNDRWTIDLSFLGPALSNYRASLSLGGSYTFDPDNISNAIMQDLIDKFPGLGDLLAGNTLSTGGKADAWAFGYRYQLQVGYRFGKKR